MEPIYQVQVTGKDIDPSDVYTTSDQPFWSAMRAKEVYPFRVALTDSTVQLSYEMKAVLPYFSEVINGKSSIYELSAYGTIVLWKAQIGAMKMLSNYSTDLTLAKTAGPGEKNKIHAHTTDQYLVWVLSYRGVSPVKFVSRGRDTMFEFGPEQIAQVEAIFFEPFMGDVNQIINMRNTWRNARFNRMFE